MVANKGKDKLQEALNKVEQIPVPPWEMSVHEHRNDITNQVHEIFAHVPKASGAQRKPYDTPLVLGISAVRT